RSRTPRPSTGGMGSPTVPASVSFAQVSPFGYGQEWWVNGSHRFTSDGQYPAQIEVVDNGTADELGGSRVILFGTFIVTGANPQTPSQSDKTKDNKISAILNGAAAGGAGCAVVATAGVISAPVGLGCGAFSAVTWLASAVFSFFGADPP